jgi:hypothetical protein
MSERVYRDQTTGSGTDYQERAHPRRPYGHPANPGDPPVQRPPTTERGIMPGPHYLGLAGRTAIVQGQVFLVAVILVLQLWLITDALYDLLSGSPGMLGWLTLMSALGFILALIITFWPRRRIRGM